ncbi:MAG: hypothetical protein ACRDJ9_20935 [Dehalococcoidia bacterium]
MAQQTENDPGAIPPALEAKLRQLADDLTPEERTQLRALPPENDIGEPSPSLRAKLQRSVDGLTAEEQAQLRLLLESVGSGAAAGAEADAQGYMKPVYEGPFGYKGRPGTDPELNQPGGGNSGALDGVPIVGLLVPTAQSLPTWGRLLGQMFGL